MTKPQGPNTAIEPPDMTTLLMAAAQDDEIVRKAVRMLAMKVLDRADYLLEEGSPATRITVIRAIMPALVKTLEKKQDDDELAELRKVLNEVRDELRTGPTTIVRIPGPPVVPTDVAPIPTPQPTHDA